MAAGKQVGPSGTEDFVFRTKDPYGNTVDLLRRRWEEKILFGHADMVGKEGLVRVTIEEPTVIYESPVGTNRFVFDRYDLMLPRKNIVRAVVEYGARDIEGGNTGGTVVTAYTPLEARAGLVGKPKYFSGRRISAT